MDKYVDLITLKHLLLISLFSAPLMLIDGGGVMFIPLIIGSYLVYQFYQTRQRIKYIIYLLPFIFFIVFITAGGVHVIPFNDGNLIYTSNVLARILVGLWCAYVVLLLVWIFFKRNLRPLQFLMLTILIPIPYLLGFESGNERMEGFLFFLFWNGGLSVALSNYFLPLNKKNNVS